MRRTLGFTLVELAVALSILFVIGGFVIARVDAFSTRQALASSARALGNTIRLYREKAQEEEEIYTLRMELDRGTYMVSCQGEKIRRGKLGPGQSFGKVYSGPLASAVEVPSPVVLNLGPRGLVPELRISIENPWKEKITLTIAALANEVAYAEPEK